MVIPAGLAVGRILLKPSADASTQTPRLVRIKLINLNGNPLGGRLADGGPTLQQVWLGPDMIEGGDGGSGSGSKGCRQQQELTGGNDDGSGSEDGEAGGDAAASSPGPGKHDLRKMQQHADSNQGPEHPEVLLQERVGGSASSRRRAAAEAARAAEQLRRRTERLMRYLLALQEPSEALAVKQVTWWRVGGGGWCCVPHAAPRDLCPRC